MKIVSKFQDYYDCGQFLGGDKRLVYTRFTSKDDEKINAGLWPDGVYKPTETAKDIDYEFKKVDKMEFELKYVSFCGVVYPYVTLTITSPFNPMDKFMNRTKSSTVYNMREFEHDLRKYVGIKEYKSFIAWSLREDDKRWSESNYTWIKNFLKAKNGARILGNNLQKIHYEQKCPIFKIETKLDIDNGRRYNMLITINPVLEEIGFYRIEDAYSAYQEIEMFMGGVVAQKENEVVQIEDKYIAAGKGYDCYSFRKEPTKKSRKKCKCNKK